MNKALVTSFKIIIGLIQQFNANELIGFIKDNFIYTFKQSDIKVNDPKFRSLKKILLLMSQARSVFQELSMYSKNEENQYHNNMYSLFN